MRFASFPYFDLEDPNDVETSAHSVYCCGRHPMFGSLNCDHISKPVQTVTHAVRLNELTVVKKRANIETDIAGH